MKPENPVCSLCGESFETEEQLEEHRELAHASDRGVDSDIDLEETAA